ncbi:MAG: RNA polymerase sigma factor [Planctomycetota bacterium]|jgi:RNA polymerase sigma factor (sigma-70 family)
MSQNTEQNWVERAKQGEPAAIAELFRLYWRAARAAAYGVTGDFALAEDAASEAFHAAIENLPDLRDTQRFGPWLRTIVVRTARRQKVKTSKENGAEFQTLPDAETSPPGADLERQEMAALIHEAVGHLSETLRESVVLFYFEGYSLKEAAGFSDIPEGTLKRRLHDGRRRLREAAEQILKGAKPMNAKREQILQQLQDASKEGIQSEAERERMLRDGLGRIYSASERARDSNHPVGAAANAIRAALPEFQQWQIDWSEMDISGMARNMFSGKADAFLSMMPPGFNTDAPGSYIHPIRAWLIEDEDGLLRTSFEIMQSKDTREAMLSQMKQGGRLSDAMSLLWKRAETLELRAVEELLRRLSNAIVPNAPVSFRCYKEPRYRAGLRMQLAPEGRGDNPVPAAIGGVHNPWPGIPEGICVASVLIYLEPWAEARSGQVVELADFSPFDLLKKDRQ